MSPEQERAQEAAIAEQARGFVEMAETVSKKDLAFAVRQEKERRSAKKRLRRPPKDDD